MIRKDIMVIVNETKEPIKKNLYKLIASEIDRSGEDTTLIFIKIVKSMIKNIRGNKQNEITRYELSLLYELIPNPIDVDLEFDLYINNALAIRSEEGALKYFKNEFDCRYDPKKLKDIINKSIKIKNENL